MPDYIQQLPAWPRFTWDQHRLSGQLAAVRHRQGRLIGRMQALGFALREEAVLQTLTEDVLKSSEIEGEILDKEEVRSSIARRLGMEAAALPPADRHVEGVVEMMLDATQRFGEPLSSERLLAWHASLFPTGRSGMRRILVGAWRDDQSGPMQVVSGAEGRERVHYKAPAAARLDTEMKSFLDWFNTEGDIDPVLKAALAQLWLVTIHLFDDGNGRIARAIADMSLARSEGSPQRFYSMSAQIWLERKDYYDMLESTQKADLDVTPWMEWFLGCLDRAFGGAEKTLAIVFRKAEFWRAHSTTSLNDRQRDMINRLLDGFEGKLTSSRWATIEKCSPDTALRDIAGLVERRLLSKNDGGGRSTSYSLADALAE
jgi:Fic family protein